MKINIKIFHDPDCGNPTDNDGLAFMALFHNRYTLPNHHKINAESFNSWHEIEQHIHDQFKAPVILPVYLYDHSGLAFSTSSFSCNWDSGQVGFIYATRDSIKECFGVKRISQDLKAAVTEQLKVILEDYNQWQSGDCYGYQIEDEDGEIVDSCAGYIGREAVNQAATEAVSAYVGSHINDIEVEY